MSKKEKQKKERKIFVVGGDLGYINWMEGDADLVVFTGGEDVDPRLYGDERHPLTYSNYERDKREVAAYVKAKMLRKPCVGICRGSQFLCVMNGGRLVQDQQNPSFMHKMHCRDTDSSIWVSSTHHQAQLPEGDRRGHLVIGMSIGVSPHHSLGDGSEADLYNGWEAEVVVYHGAPGDLGIQSHPEMVYDGYHHDERIKGYIDWCRNVLNQFLENGIISSWLDFRPMTPPVLSPFVEWKNEVPVGPTEVAKTCVAPKRVARFRIGKVELDGVALINPFAPIAEGDNDDDDDDGPPDPEPQDDEPEADDGPEDEDGPR